MSKILLVEDDKSLREIYGVRLAAEGYEIVSVGDGEEALTVAIKERPDLIISDVMMPKISGFDMLDILRATPETKDLKVIMMTALSSDDQRARGEALGADRYLVKSQVGIEDVVRTVHEVLGDTPGAIAPAGSAFSTPTEPSVAPEINPANPTVDQAQPAADLNTIQPQPTPPAEATPSMPAMPPIDAPVASPVAPVEPTAPEQNVVQTPAEASTPEPYPRAIDTPSPEPTVISTPEPAAAVQPPILPQPVAPFSSSAPASLGDQITAAAQAAASTMPETPSMPPTTPPPVAAVDPATLTTPVGAVPAADPIVATPAPSITPEQQPVVMPTAPAIPEQPIATQQPQVNPGTPNISDLINQELQSGTTTPQQ
jgi:DNA-binding response OmpR family regulator